MFADKEEQKKRLKICETCDKRNKFNICKECGCFIAAKVKLEMSECPLGKWDIKTEDDK